MPTPSNTADALAEATLEIEQLRIAVQSNRVIATAIGILMERFQLDRDHAFDFLARDSSHRNVKLRDVASALVESAEHR